MKAIHYVLLVLGAMAMMSHGVAQAMPQYAAVAHIVGGTCVSLATSLGLVSPAVSQKEVANVEAAASGAPLVAK